jgi:hypothetical protein
MVAGGTRQVAMQGICVLRVGLEMGQSGRLHYASSLERKREGKEKGKWAGWGFGLGEI